MIAAFLLWTSLTIACDAQGTSTNRLEMKAHISLNSLLAIHTNLLRLASNETGLAGYSATCYAPKAMAILFVGPGTNAVIQLQLFTHATAPHTANRYNTTIIGEESEYDILGYLSDGLLQTDTIREAICSALATQTIANNKPFDTASVENSRGAIQE